MHIGKCERLKTDKRGSYPCLCPDGAFGLSPASYQQAIGKLVEKLEAAENELRSIDEALARRPALSDLPDRYSKVMRACELAGRAERGGGR
jgi:hypothetical protein